MTQVTTPFQIPIGPTHAALKEPVMFKFTIEGEKVVGVDYQPGVNHRGVEFLGMKRNPLQAMHLAERICGICSAIHQFCFSMAVERAADIQPSERGDYLKVIVQELERIHSHILWAGVAGHEVGFDTVLHLTWKMRENLLDVQEALCGNRVNYSMYAIGGVRRDITPEIERALRKSLNYYKEVYPTLEDIFLNNITFKMRLRDVGILSRENAIKYSACGPTVRGTGLKIDVRATWPHSAYGDLDFHAITPQDAGYKAVGDVYDKTIVRLLEIVQSIDLIEQCLDNMPSGPITSEPKMIPLLNKLKKADGEGLARSEAPRGEDIHYVRLDAGNPNLAAWKVRAPTYGNLHPLATMLMGCTIADIPIIVASIDPCIGCMDRVEFINKDTRKRQILTGQELHRLSVAKTRGLMK